MFYFCSFSGCNNLLSFVWQLYVVNYAHSSIKDYILNLMHGHLLTLPWNRFTPSFQDIDLMLRVIIFYFLNFSPPLLGILIYLLLSYSKFGKFKLSLMDI